LSWDSTPSCWFLLGIATWFVIAVVFIWFLLVIAVVSIWFLLVIAARIANVATT
jgi:hypothetical protein